MPDKEAQLFVFTTMPAEWMMLYDQKAYVEVDPRMQLIARSTMPVLWEQRISGAGVRAWMRFSTTPRGMGRSVG